MPVLVNFMGASTFGSIAASQAAAVGMANVAWQAALSAVIGAVGITQQFQLNSRMTTVAERGMTVAEDTYQLSLNNYNQVVLPAFTRAETHYDATILPMRGHIDTYLDAGIGNSQIGVRPVDYSRDLARAQGDIAKTFRRVRTRMTKRYGKYRTGAICYQNVQIDLMEAASLANVANQAYRYSESRQIIDEDRVWSRKSAAAQLAYNMSALSMNGIHRGVTGTISSINSVTSASAGVASAGQQVIDVLQARSNLVGSAVDSFGQLVGRFFQADFYKANPGPYGAMLGNAQGGVLPNSMGVPFGEFGAGMMAGIGVGTGVYQSSYGAGYADGFVKAPPQPRVSILSPPALSPFG